MGSWIGGSSASLTPGAEICASKGQSVNEVETRRSSAPGAERGHPGTPPSLAPPRGGWAFGASPSNDNGLRESWGKCKVGPRVC